MLSKVYLLNRLWGYPPPPLPRRHSLWTAPCGFTYLRWKNEQKIIVTRPIDQQLTEIELNLVFPDSAFEFCSYTVLLDKKCTLFASASQWGKWFLAVEYLNRIFLEFWPVVPGCARCAMVHPDFGRSVNPISTRGTDYAHLITNSTPGFLDLPTALILWNEWWMQIQKGFHPSCVLAQ